MKEYNIIYQKTPDWSQVPSIDIDFANWKPNPGIDAKAQIAWNEEKIMYHGTAKEENIRAEYDGVNMSVWEDSCLEFFFKPANENRYLNFEVNPNASIYFGIGTNMPDRVRLLLQDEKGILNIRTNRTADGWEVFAEFPIYLLQMFYPGYELKAGNVLKANCMKCGDLTVNPHFLSWAPFDPENPDFHAPDYFETMTLV